MELRRALLLFAVVLGLAAIASSLNRPAEEESGGEREQAQSTPESADRRGAPSDDTPAASRRTPEPEAGEAATIRFKAGGAAETRRLEAGSAATVLVEVSDPGQVQLKGLGLTQPADLLTPARFDVLVDRPVSSKVIFQPASGGPPEVVGTLAVKNER